MQTKSGVPAEIQMNSPEMIYAKEERGDAIRVLGQERYDALASRPGMPEGGKGPTFFEERRVLSRTPPQARAVASPSKDYYKAGQSAATRAPQGGT